uniref:Laminin subunit beta-2-like n=1 Tax=Echeneis naucrates TaxID=173247 RepID=A0A665WEU1_ECHNA
MIGVIILYFIPPSALTVCGQELPSGPHGCTEGSCYPATGNLLIGRAVNLSATSTCGLAGPEHYCIVSHLQESDKCFECNSQHRYNPHHHRNSHRIENVIYLTDTNGDNTWWQSVNGQENVSIRLDLEAEFHFTHLIMKFKTFRPAAMMIERSADFGRTWRPYRYFASNCTRNFPGIPSNGLHHINDIICEERYSDIEPSTNGEVIYKVLDPAIHVKDPYSLNIQELLRITNLRMNFTKLNTLGDDLLDRRFDVLQKYYYAIYELVVRGSCFCYGHASECVPVPGVDTRENGMVSSWTVWPKQYYSDNNQCNCNGHSTQCHFDMAVYLATGNVSGGVCDDCQHNTMGRNCETCKPFYYKDQIRDIKDPRVCVGESFLVLRCITCDCDPVGSLEGGVCDSHTDPEMGMIAGQCRCKANVKGMRCDDSLFPSLQPEYWGLSNDLGGCRPCDCDFGGAFHNRCMMENGQCDCRRHLIGRQCSEVQPGYFCAPLDYYKYEAEDATGHSPDVRPVHRKHTPSHMVTWTGPGFARVKDGAGLVFTFDNIPYAMQYDIMIRYEPEVCDITSVQLPSSLRCGNLLPTEQLYTVTLPHHSRYIQMPRPFCFEPSNRYVVAIRFQRHGVSHRHLTAFILIDSVREEFLNQPRLLHPLMRSHLRLQLHIRTVSKCFVFTITFQYAEMVHYMCLDSFMITPMPMMLIGCFFFSLCAACQCDPQGSLSGECDKVGGQCRCKANVMGRRCDQCAPGTYGFGVSGCTVCNCHSEGSLSHQCDPVTGQCQCRQGATGRACSDCQPGQWGFPSCRPCQCNGHADLCDPHTGECTACREYTAGHFCERCVDSFFGNPVLGSGEHCRPCPCPGNPGSDHFNGVSCQADQNSNQIICSCKQGYSGPRCDQCAPGYHGNPGLPGGQCLPCECNGNIDTQDPGSCDPRTGKCLKCLYHTDGPSCSHCQHGYYGNALSHDCRRCTCVTAGTLPSACSDGQCHCDQQTGACPCRENVAGHNCDECASNHWNYGQDRGCEPCHCNPQHALGAHCNMFTGQCHCHPGFGGKQCTECEQFHWGDPQVQCQECNCHPLGAEMAQCNRTTGECECREGAAGKRCDECARGFSGDFPKCIQCHPCFQLWDDALCQIKRDLEHIQYTLQKIQENGITPGVGDTRIKELEKKLKQVQDLISLEDGDRIHQLIGQNQFEKVKKYYQESLKTEKKANMSVSGPDSPVEQSKETRALTEDRLASSKNKSLRDQAAQNKSLSELQQKAHDLDKKTHHLSLKVCGGHSNDIVNGSCPDSQCGGAGCRDDEGFHVCGGDGCNGTVSASVEALDKARKVTDSLNSANEEAQDLQDIVFLMRDVKNQTMNMLEKAQMKKEHFENNNNKLKDFIKKIKDFLREEGADPESIEKVALQVLAITLPVNKTILDKMIMQIKDSLSNLTNIEAVINQTSQHISKAKELLEQAKDAK